MVAQRTEPVLIQRRLEPPRAPGGKGVRGCASARSVCCGGIPERGAPVLRGFDVTTEITEGHREGAYWLCALCVLCGYFFRVWGAPRRFVRTTETTEGHSEFLFDRCAFCGSRL